MRSARPPLRILMTAHLKADPRKSAVLAVLAVVMLVLYARWFWPSGGPEQAEAAGIPALLSSGDQKSGPAASAAPVTAARTVVSEPVARELERDPFALNLRQYPAAPANPTPANTAVTAITEARPIEADDPIEAAARTLTLQSTVCGSRPIACINGKFVRPGQRINGFVLERVEPTHVVIGREGVRVELYLK